MEYKTINLNKNNLFIGRFDCGKYTVILKIHHKKYYLDINKNKSDVFIEFYDYVSNKRDDFSKYDPIAKKRSLYIKNNSILNRDFFDKIDSTYNAVEFLKLNNNIYNNLIL